MKKIAALSLLFVLAGCGKYYTVKVPYYLPESDNALEAKRALSSLYIAVKAPPEPDMSVVDDIVGHLVNGPHAEMNPGDLARKAAFALSRPGNNVLAYRVFRTKEESDPYVRYFDPAGVLEIKLSEPAVSVRKESKATTYYSTEKKQWVTSNRDVWVYSGSIKAGVILYAGAGGKVLDKMSDTFTRTEEKTDNRTVGSEWYAQNEPKLFEAVSARLQEHYIGRSVSRSRTLIRKKDDPVSVKAADLAQSGKWSEAEKIWFGRLGSTRDWRDMMNLGVTAETRKNYFEAKNYYVAARMLSAGDKEAGTVKWAEIMGDLDIALSTGALARSSAADWFAGETAILPFSDETTSIDGPPMIRTLLYESLKAAGYRLQPPEETDKLLLSHGLTQGGQLGAVDQAEICKWLGVERTFYGDIDEFGELVAGVYNRRTIKGRVTLWDLKAGNYIWALDATVSRVDISRSFMGGLISQLSKDLVERLKGKPLAYEAAIFSAKIAGGLPGRAGIK